MDEVHVPRSFSFELYRLNIEDSRDLFTDPDIFLRLRGDRQLSSILRSATSSQQDVVQETQSARFKWSLREFADYSALLHGRELLQVILARSVLEKAGPIVTDEGLSVGMSSSYPPLASTAVCFFDLSRHIVAVEYTGQLSQTAWKDHLEKILEGTARRRGLYSSVQLEPIPEKNGIVRLFLSFERVTRMKVTLRIPNPELTRYTKNLYEDLVVSGIREFTQDMRNPNGISKDENARPFASAVLAEQGYKKGEVQLEGLRNDIFEQVVSGSEAARGTVRGIRDFVRGMHQGAKTKETQRCLAAIVAEIDRVHPVRD
jgi:hypothetical protein